MKARLLTALSIIWCLLVLGSYGMSRYQIDQSALEIAYAAARAQVEIGNCLAVPLTPCSEVLEQEKIRFLIWHLAIGMVGLLFLWTMRNRLKRADEELRESQAFFHTMADWTNDWEYWIDAENRFRYLSPSAQQLTGYRPEEFIADPGLLDAIVCAEDRALWQAHLACFHQPGNAELSTLVFRLLRKDGAVRWMSHRCRPVLDAAGIDQGRRVSVQDVTDQRDAETALAEREKHYRVIYESSQDFITINRLSDGAFIDVNQPYLDALGYTREELIGRSPADLKIWANPIDRDRFIATLRRKRKCQNFEAAFRDRHGDLVWGLASSSIVELDGVDCIYSVTRNISERKQVELALSESEKTFRALYEASQDYIFINRLKDGIYLDANPPFLAACGYSRDEVLGHTALDIGLWDKLEGRQKFYEVLTKEMKISGLEVRVRVRNGQLAWWLVSASIIELNGIDCIHSVARDITERKLAEDKINELAFFDQLTGLANRTALLDRLKRAMANSLESGHHCALLMIDLDNFKSLNDTEGHDVGDSLLKQVARRLDKLTRPEDTVARLGGDEFLIILTGLSPASSEAAAQAERVAETIVKTLGECYRLGDITFSCTPSIGVTIFLGQQVDSDSLLKQVDIAMYRAKDKGGNGLCFFDADMEEQILRRAILINDLRDALHRDQFVLHYQPQVSGGRLSGVEVLVRWQHPRNGLISPGEFIPLAEESGLITPLGNRVLRSACLQLADWATNPALANISLSVNVSAQQFRQADFVEKTLTILKETKANPHRLKIELTESTLATNVEELIEKMYVLKARGIGFSLDDFGTGYSSLSYLKRLPLDQLKIDKSFVRDVFTDSNDVAIIKTIIALADSLGLAIIAEGVETVEQRDFLASIGCHVYQGYCFGCPMPVEDFEQRESERLLNGNKAPLV